MPSPRAKLEQSGPHIEGSGLVSPGDARSHLVISLQADFTQEIQDFDRLFSLLQILAGGCRAATSRRGTATKEEQ